MMERGSMIPFKRFIIAQLFLGKQPAEIQAKLQKFGYVAKTSEIEDIYLDIKSVAPDSIKDPLAVSHPVLIENGSDWFKHYDILDYMEYAEKKEHKDAFDAVVWLHNENVVCTLVNALIYNEEDLSVISAVVKFKYKKFVSQKALEIHKRIFWDVANLSAFECLERYKYFSGNSLVLVGTFDESHDDIKEAIIFRDKEYIKWKIGYKEVKAPSTLEFLDRVKADAAFMYEEAMLMTRSVTRSHSEGNNVDEDGNPVVIDNTTTSYQNVTQAKLSTAKKAVDLYLKADKALPVKKESTESDAFFEKIQQISMMYDMDEKDKIVTGEDAAAILAEMVK